MLIAPFLTKPSIEDSNAPEYFPFIGTEPCPTATCIPPFPIPPFIAIAESLNPPRLLTSRAPVEPCSVVRRLCSPEKSVKVRTLVGVAGSDCGMRRRSETEESVLGDGGMGGRLVGEGERFGGCVYTPWVCSCRKEQDDPFHYCTTQVELDIRPNPVNNLRSSINLLSHLIKTFHANCLVFTRVSM